MEPYYLGKKSYFQQRRNIKGNISFEEVFQNKKYKISFKIIDLFGLTAGSLQQLAQSCGIQMDSKEVFSKYNYDPSSMLKDNFASYLAYSMDDVFVLLQIYESLKNSFNNIMEDIYNIPKTQLFTNQNFPTTIGTVVNTIWLKNYKFNILKNNKLIHLALLKQGVLNKMHENYIHNLYYFEQLNTIKSYDQLQDYQEQNPQEFEIMYDHLSQSKVFLFQIYQYATPNFLISESANSSTRPILGVTSGLRSEKREARSRGSHCKRTSKGIFYYKRRRYRY
jgi:hypothetical protein